jgi:hypothetical protein
MERNDAFGYGVRTADDSDLAEPSLCLEVLLGRNPPPNLLAAAAIACGQLLGCWPGRLPGSLVSFADDDEATNRHLGDIAPGILERSDASPNALDRLLTALQQYDSAVPRPGGSVLAIGRNVNRRMRTLHTFRLN